MKKTMIILTAMASMMTACTNDETLDVVSSQPIAFTNAFIENSTRAAIDGSYTKDNLQAFQVYGTITNSANKTANIFNGTEVTKDNGVWTYSNIQYWIEGNTYNFTAIVDGNVKGGETYVTEVTTDETTGMPTSITLNDIAQQKDILYAIAIAENVTASYNEKVSFTFSHLLAKAKFEVFNNIANTAYTYKISDVKITNAPKKATYTISTGSWAFGTEENNNSGVLNFGNIASTSAEATAENPDGADASSIASKGTAESNWERLLIPGNQSLTVTFKKELYINDVLVKTVEAETISASNITLKPGHSYNLKITLDAPGNPITFDVEKLNDWNTDHNNDGTSNDDTPLNGQTQS